MRQSAPEAGPLTDSTWREAVAGRVRRLCRDGVEADVRPFLERTGELVGKGEVLELLR